MNDILLFHYPDQQIIWLNEAPKATLHSDAMLFPAILNLLQNAVLANQKHAQMQLELSWQQPGAQSIAFVFRDFGAGFSPSQLAELGGQLMPSEQGMGIAVMLSNATFERLNGSLTVYNHPEGGAVAKVTLPLLTAETKA